MGDGSDLKGTVGVVVTNGDTLYSEKGVSTRAKIRQISGHVRIDTIDVVF